MSAKTAIQVLVLGGIAGMIYISDQLPMIFEKSCFLLLFVLELIWIYLAICITAPTSDEDGE